MARPVKSWVISPHATALMARRGIGMSVVAEVLQTPEQRFPARPGRDVLQKRVDFDGKTYVVRVFVDIDREPPEVVTVYRSSKVEKYWSHQS